MRNPLEFFVELLKAPTWVAIWVFVQMAANMLSLMFWQERLAKIILVTFLVSACLMMGLYSVFGFQKILGAGHVLWVPLLVYIFLQIGDAGGSFRSYLIALSAILTVSLAFDVVDVWKWFSSSG